MAKARICIARHSKGKAKNRYDAKSKGIAGKSGELHGHGKAMLGLAKDPHWLAQR